MTRTRILSWWKDPSAARSHRTAVSLHSHTLYSHEMLAFVPRFMRKLTFFGETMADDNHLCRAWTGGDSDITRFWWTPPLGPLQAWRLEESQIANRLDSAALVSITDHDSIEAPMMLRILDETRFAPISVEWTVPYGGTFFHLGMHNLPWRSARSVFAEMAALTRQPDQAKLAAILHGLSADPDVLIVFNHPLWDEKGIGKPAHRKIAEQFLASHRGCIHALEWNGFRTFRENASVGEMAEAYGLPVISGGDRHGREPNSNLNLTNAATFPEFVREVRRDGVSEVLLMPQQREHLALRFLRAVCDIVREDPQHGMGWTKWPERIFYLGDDGIAQPVSVVWGERRAPRLLSGLVKSLQQVDRLLAHPRLRAALGWRTPDEEEASL